MDVAEVVVEHVERPLDVVHLLGLSAVVEPAESGREDGPDGRRDQREDEDVPHHVAHPAVVADHADRTSSATPVYRISTSPPGIRPSSIGVRSAGSRWVTRTSSLSNTS